MATVYVPALLRPVTDGAERLELPLAPGERITVRALLERLDARHPGLLDALLYEDDLLPGIAVFIDDDQALLRLQARVEADSEVRFLPPVVGG